MPPAIDAPWSVPPQVLKEQLMDRSYSGVVAREEEHRDSAGFVGAAGKRLVGQLETRNNSLQPVAGRLGADVLVNGENTARLPGEQAVNVVGE